MKEFTDFADAQTHERGRGVLMHVTSLPGRYGCGTFGSAAEDFIRRLGLWGYGYWQVLPFGMTGLDGSPYKCFSAFAGNPLLIDPDELGHEGLLRQDELDAHARRCADMTYSCDWRRLIPDRLALLRLAAGRASKIPSKRHAALDFASGNVEIMHFCEFMAQRRSLGGGVVGGFDLGEEIFFYAFTQQCFFGQWEKVRAAAHAAGIKIIGDLPMYVDLESADVAYHPELFLLDGNLRPLAVAGVPPDYFSPYGQKWGNPLYDWEEMGRGGYGWWIRRIKWQFKLFDGLRLDHFRGFSAFYSVLPDAPNALGGEWVKGPGMRFISKVKDVAAGRIIIAEDLGEIDAEAEALVRQSGFLGTRVFQFGFSGENSPHLPHNYPKNCVACSGTHDNTTLLGYISGLSEEERRLISEYVGFCGGMEGLCDAVLRAISRSHANLIIFPIQDILCLGAASRMNIPGTSSGNWRFRVTSGQLDSIDVSYRRFLGALYGRCSYFS